MTEDKCRGDLREDEGRRWERNKRQNRRRTPQEIERMEKLYSREVFKVVSILEKLNDEAERFLLFLFYFHGQLFMI